MENASIHVGHEIRLFDLIHHVFGCKHHKAHVTRQWYLHTLRAWLEAHRGLEWYVTESHDRWPLTYSREVYFDLIHHVFDGKHHTLDCTKWTGFNCHFTSTHVHV